MKYKPTDIKAGDQFYIKGYGTIRISHTLMNGISVSYSMLKEGKDIPIFASCRTYNLCELLSKNNAKRIE